VRRAVSRSPSMRTVRLWRISRPAKDPPIEMAIPAAQMASADDPNGQASARIARGYNGKKATLLSPVDE